jgi:glycerol-3-phosphate dehydrogenase
MTQQSSQGSFTRTGAMRELGNEIFDLLVVGGGIAGACAAWDAALRGLRVALIEQADFGSGTSSHSLKILHGGIRYLQHLDFARVRATCAERTAFLRIAPHLTRPLAFAVPTYGRGMQGKLALRAAFVLNELLTSNRNRGIEDAQCIPRPFMLSRDEFMRKLPAFAQPGLSGAGVFFDGQVCNPPRLVYSIVRSAQEAGAVATNYCSAQRLLIRDGQVEGVLARDVVTADTFDIRARVVANMAGPFAPLLHAQGGASDRISVPVTRDMALVVDRRLLPDMGVAVQTRYRDPGAVLSRGNIHLFMAPWRESFTTIGVHSRLYEGDPDRLTVSEAEIDAFIAQINEAVPALEIRREEVKVVNAGLLPTGENAPGEQNLTFGKRSPLIDHSARGGPRGLITGMSVLLTMGRALAQQVVDLGMEKLGKPGGTCRTATTGVWRSAFRTVSQADAPASLLPDGSTSADEVAHVARDEMVVTLADVVLRRLDLGTARPPSEALLTACARIVGRQLGWDSERQRREIGRVNASYPFANPQSQAFVSASRAWRSAS